MIEVLVDEYQQRVDKKLWKTSICCLESSERSLEKYLDELGGIIASDSIRFPDNGKKLHFSEMNDAQRKIIVEYIAKLPLAAKIYTYYMINPNGAEAKRTAMLNAIDHLRWLHRTKKIDIRIEYADEYKKTGLAPFMRKDCFDFILPDAILSVYSKHLNEIGKSNSSSNAQFYSLLKEKIRLQVFTATEHAEYAVRDERI